MRTQTPQKTELFAGALRKVYLRVFAVCAALVIVAAYYLPHLPLAAAATNGTLNFQARLETAAGAIVPDGYYNVQFKLYDTSSGGTALWTESYIDGNGAAAGNDNRVQVINGYISVNLGSLSAFPGTINWDQQLWLTMNIGGTAQTAAPAYDGEMNPRLQLTGVPYAFQAKSATQLQALQGTYAGTLNFNTLSASRTISLPDEDGTVCLQGSAGCGFLTTAAANSSFIQLQGATPGLAQTGNFNISGTGIANVLQGTTSVMTANLDTVSAGVLNIGSTNATQINLNKNVVVAASQTITMVGGTTALRPASPTEGMLYFDTTTKSLLVYANGKWQGDRSTATKIVAASNSSQAVKDAADYVATGTGDQATINNALIAASGGKVYLTEGTFRVNASISVPSNTTLIGSGAGTVITVPNGTTGIVTLVSNSNITTGNTGITVTNMTLDGNGANITGYTTGIVMASDYTGTNISDITLSELIFRGFTGEALYSEASHATIVNNKIYDSSNGIDMEMGDKSIISGNIISGASNTAILIVGSTNNTIVGNTVDQSNTGIDIEQNSGDSIVANNVVTNSSNIGIYINASGNTVTGNNISESGGTTANNGIYLNGASNNTITGNTITDSSATSTNYAINIFNSASSGNYLANNTLGGGSINDLGTGTIYASQLTPANYLQSTGSLLTAQSASTNIAGTVSYSSGSNVVTGSGTAFTTALTAGDTIVVNGETRVVTAITSNTSLTATPASAAAAAGATLARMQSVLVVKDGSNKYKLSIGNNGNVNIGGPVSKAAQVSMLNTDATQQTLVLQAAAGQTVNILGIYNSSGSFVSGYDSAGNAFINGYLQSGTTTAAGQIRLKDGTAGNHKVTLTTGALTVDRTINLPDEDGTVCLRNSANCGFLTGSAASGTYVQLQGSTPGTTQTGHFNISGTGIASVLQATTVNATTGFSFNGTAGATTTCTAGNVLSNAVIRGGIVTGGTCVAGGGGGGGSYVTLQASTPGTADVGSFNINGTGIAGILQGTAGVRTANLDTATAGDLAIGATNATSVTIAPATSINNTLTVTGGLVERQSVLLTGTVTTATNYRMRLQGTLSSSSTTYQYGLDNSLNFSPTGASLNNIFGLVNLPTLSGSSINVGSMFGATMGIQTGAGFTGQLTNGEGLHISGPDISGSKKIMNYSGINITENTTNGGNTSGLINNSQLTVGGITAGAGVGGTVDNTGIKLMVPSGTGGTTRNYGLYIQGNGGGSTSYSIYNTSTALSHFAGSINSVGGYQYNGTAGATVTCTAGNVLSNAVIQGGIVTGGTCVAGGGGGGGVTSLNSLAGALTLQGTTGQITVTGNGSNTVTLALDSKVTLQGNTFNVANSLVKLDGGGTLTVTNTATSINTYGDIAVGGGLTVSYNASVAGKLTVSGTSNSSFGGTVSGANAVNSNDFVTKGQLDSAIGGVGGGGSYVNLQATTPGPAQTGHFNINGTGIAGILQATTSVQTPLVDTATATTLNIGTTNATAINLNQNTTIASGKSLTVGGGNVTFTGLATGSASALTVNLGSVGNVGLTINGKAGQSADYIRVVDSSNRPVFNLDNNGGAWFTSTTDTTQAFQVMDSGNNSLFNVDTQHGSTVIGTFSSAGTWSSSLTVTNPWGAKTNVLDIQGASTTDHLLLITANGNAQFRNKNDSATAFVVQNATGNAVLTADTSAGQVLFGKASTLSGKLVLANSTNANTITITTGATSANYTITLPTSVGGANQCLMNSATPGVLTWGSCGGGGGGGTKTVKLAPEYPGTVFTPSGSNNVGFMTSDYIGGLGASEGYKHNYYSWATDQSPTPQSYGIITQVQLPSDFSSFAANSFSFWTYVDSTTSTGISVMINDATGKACYVSAQSVKPASTKLWTQVVISNPANGCSFAAGDLIAITITPQAVAPQTDFVRVGEFKYTYNAL